MKDGVTRFICASSFFRYSPMGGEGKAEGGILEKETKILFGFPFSKGNDVIGLI
jgi:hypothetical protein